MPNIETFVENFQRLQSVKAKPFSVLMENFLVQFEAVLYEFPFLKYSRPEVILSGVTQRNGGTTINGGLRRRIWSKEKKKKEKSVRDEKDIEIPIDIKQ